jgi:hypothetical protein
MNRRSTMGDAVRPTTSSLMTTKILAGAAAVAGTLLIAGAMLVVTHRAAEATAAYASQTKKPCGNCHQNPSGGGKLKPAGEKFKARGYK